MYYCDTCEYKFTKVDELNQHKKKKHEIELVPCKTCEFVARGADNLNKHVESRHKSTKEHTEKRDPAKNVNISNENTNVKIPCVICEFTSTSAEDFINHIETKHQQNMEAGNNKPIYKCNRDYKGHI